MFEIFGMTAILVIMIILFMFAKRLKDNPMVEVMAVDGDEDIKIAGDSFGIPTIVGDSSDEAAKEFLMEKESGNIELAGQLGELLANELWSVAQDLIMKDDGQMSEKEVHQRIILKSYAVNVMIADYSPSDLLAETTLSVFYRKIEDLSQVFYRHVSDTSAFSFYILNHRKNSTEDGVGRIYAKLCDKEGSIQKINEGNEIYNNFYDSCKKIAEENISYNV